MTVRADPHAEGNSASRVTLRDRPAYGRGLVGAVVLALTAGIVYSFATGNIRWESVAQYFLSPRILEGLWATLFLWIIALILGAVVGVGIALMRISKSKIFSSVAWTFVWIFRGVPVYVQFAIWFNISLVFPVLVIPFVGEYSTVVLVTPLVASVLALALSEAAYLAEIIRGGILSVDAGQYDAGKALGIHNGTTMRRIILPQAMRSIIPPAGNEAITLLKTTSLAASIAYSELLTNSQSIYFSNGQVMELLIVASIWYMIITSLLSIGQVFVERRFYYAGKAKRILGRRAARPVA